MATIYFESNQYRDIGSDLHILSGAVPQTTDMVMGHEFMGIVEEVGAEVKNLKNGRSGVVPFPIALGSVFSVTMRFIQVVKIPITSIMVLTAICWIRKVRLVWLQICMGVVGRTAEYVRGALCGCEPKDHSG